VTGSFLILLDENMLELPVTGRFCLTKDFNPGTEGDKYTCVLTADSLHINETALKPYIPVSLDGAILIWMLEDTLVIPYPSKGMIRLGSDGRQDITVISALPLRCVLEPNLLRLEEGTCYHNGKLVKNNNIRISSGDILVFPGFRVTVQEGRIILGGAPGSFKSSLYDHGPVEQYFEGFPLYKRSPRIIKRLPDDTVNLTKPPAKPEKQKGQLLKMIIPPAVMLIMTIAVQIIMPRGIYALIGIATTLTSAAMTVTNYFNERKDEKKEEAERQQQYEGYLLRQRKVLHGLRQKQIESMRYHYPPPKEIAKMARGYSNRIYERNANDSDFLTVSIGNSTHQASYTVSKGAEDVLAKEDPLLTEMTEMADEFQTIPSLPTVIDLKQAHFGFVGEKKIIQEQLMLLLTQLCFFQSYYDLEIICLFDSNHRRRYEWLKWFPHCKLRAINVTGLVDSDNVRDQVLGNLTQVIKDRKLKQEEKKKETLYLPHYLFVVDEPSLLINHSIMEYLQLENSGLGFSLIYTTDMLASLPENIKTVVELGDSKSAALIMNEGKLTSLPVSLEQPGGIPLDDVSRSLAALNHLQGVSTQIPESITFFELYGIKHPEELGVERRWQSASSHKSLAVPLGVRAKDDYVLLNLHEKAHGPHGLVAGTTGSGKSEIIQSYILSLAVNFHPYEVGFLLIDYKGGGMASLFEKLPHLLGTITNLDGGESLRAMASIKSELARRQRVFNEHGVNHINQYNKLFKSGEAKNPMPHLFLISDEFAELKKDQPDFMTELVSAARIGRSLGIHLILATQKPTGVVDDQIWSNSKFKLALKVQDASDSNEVIKTPDAANITQPGRAYLQVGNNEVYELFQSAWSGAPYSREQEAAGFDDRVYLMNKLGQRQLLGEDLSGGLEEESRQTQIGVVVEHIQAAFDEMNIPLVERPWFPPLEFRIPSPHIKEAVDVASFTGLSSGAALGMVDIPEQQLQREWVYDFAKDGNLAVFGSSGFGKSVTLMTFMLTLAIKNSPSLLRYYVIDLGNAALAQMRGLPHTVDYLSIDDTEKFDKFTKYMGETMAGRKALFAAKNALNFIMYNAVSEEKIPAIVIVIDNYDVIREIGIELEDFWTKLTRDGAGIGIYVVASATRAGAFKYVVLNNFKSKIAHHLIDENDQAALIGRTPYSLNEKPGRAFIKLSGVNMMQIYTPVPMEGDISYANNVGALVDGIKECYSGARVEGLRILPEVLDYALLKKYAGAPERGLLPLGLDFKEVEVQALSMSNPIHLIIGTSASGKTNVLRLCLESLEDAERILLIDSREMELARYQGRENITYCSNQKQMEGILTELKEIV
jgi:S-DNA-T family DNA segregation ATPase FtsK/SpoIIIE